MTTEPDPTLAEAERLAHLDADPPGRAYCIEIDSGHLRVLLAELDRLRRDGRAMADELNDAVARNDV